jgi:hypothetical protein
VISFDFLNFCGLSKNWRSGILGAVAKPVVKHKKSFLRQRRKDFSYPCEAFWVQKKRREVKTVNEIHSSSQLARRLVAKPLPTFSACSNRVIYSIFSFACYSKSLFPAEPASAKVRKVQNRNPLTFLAFEFQMPGTIGKSNSDHIPAIGAA